MKMKSKQAGLRSMLLLGVIFILGLSVWYISQHNPGFNPYAVYMRKPTDLDVLPEVRPLHQSGKQSNAVLPSPWMEQNSGVVYDCIMWNPLYRYDTAEVDKNYRTLQDIRGPGEADDHRKNAFVEIYNKQIWGSRHNIDVSKDDINYKASGDGSALEVAQGVMAMYHTIIDRLKRELNKTRIKILDLPCGDLQYMSYFLKTRDDIDYTGADIVPELIAKHTERYKGSNTIHFKNIDIVKDDLKDAYDLIICRMMLQHLKHEDVLKTLYHFSSSNSTYLAATTFSNEKVNKELDLGRPDRHRRLNLEKPPISLSPPVCSYYEVMIPHNFVAIWKLPLLQHI